MLHTLALGWCLSLLVGARVEAQGEPFVLIDATFTATAQNTSSSEYGVEPLPGVPENWRSPIDYSAGRVHVRVEVIEKPSSMRTLCNVCLAAGDKLTCMPYPPPYATPGTYDSEPKISSFWQYDVYDWTKPVEEVRVVVKDENGRFVQGNAAYFPTTLHVTVTVVPPGAEYKEGAVAAPRTSPDGGVAMTAAAAAGAEGAAATTGSASMGMTGMTGTTGMKTSGAASNGGAGAMKATRAPAPSAAGSSSQKMAAVPVAGMSRQIEQYIEPGSSCAVLHSSPKARYGEVVSIALALGHLVRSQRRRKRCARVERSHGRRR
jgi:hypothetical protein